RLGHANSPSRRQNRLNCATKGGGDPCHKDVWLSLAAPLLEQEGWTRPQENAAKPPLKGADGVVAHRNAVGMLSARLSVIDHPGSSRHPSCARRGARAKRFS